MSGSLSPFPNPVSAWSDAIKLPGQGEEPVYLPIDSKFPLEDYYRLEEAYESGEKEEIERYRKALLASIKRFAKDIQQKYLFPPATTNFGILFLPTEGLYSEVVRNPEFFDRLRRDEQILVAGPSTLSALLNSLSVGFKTLNIQKSADDISKVLGSVKSEFHKFGGILAKTQRHLKNASNNIDDLLTRRTSAIERTLRQIESDEDLLGLDVYIEDGEDDGSKLQPSKKKMKLFEGFYLIKSAEVRQTRAGKNYLAFVFQDETGTIEGKLWDAQPHNVESFMAGRVVHMSGRREVYNNTPASQSIEHALATSRRAQQSSRLQGKTTSRS